MRPVFLGVGLMSVVAGIVLLVRPDTTARYHDGLSMRGQSVSGEFGAAISRRNGPLFVFVGALLFVIAVT